MGSKITVMVVVAALAWWRLSLRRNPNWAANDDARFYVSAGTWAVLIALYWFLQSRLTPDWVWQAWPALAIGAFLLLKRGVDHLAMTPDRFETVPLPSPAEDRHPSDGILAHLAPHRQPAYRSSSRRG
jgi:hypothetical protein